MLMAEKVCTVVSLNIIQVISNTTHLKSLNLQYAFYCLSAPCSLPFILSVEFAVHRFRFASIQKKIGLKITCFIGIVVCFRCIFYGLKNKQIDKNEFISPL